jgi:hypothetical protein
LLVESVGDVTAISSAELPEVVPDPSKRSTGVLQRILPFPLGSYLMELG